MTFPEGSQAAISRPDLVLLAVEGKAAFLTGPDSRYTILPTAGHKLCKGRRRYGFEGPSLYATQATGLTGQRAPFGSFAQPEQGDYYWGDIAPGDVGKPIRVDQADETVKNLMDGGASWDEIERWAAVRSMAQFIEQIEVAGTLAAGGLTNATTPFTAAAVDGGDVSPAIRWDQADSNPIGDVKGVVDGLRGIGVFPDTIYLSQSCETVLSQHAEFAGMWGGNVGHGALSLAQLAAGLKIQRVIVGLDRYYDANDHTVIVCQQGVATGDTRTRQDDYTVIYGYDAEFGTGEFGLRGSVESMAGSHGRCLDVLVSAYCGTLINPTRGRRLVNVLT